MIRPAESDRMDFNDPHLDLDARMAGSPRIQKPCAKPFFHYTSTESLEGIMRDGCIKTCPWIEEDKLIENDFATTRTFICDVGWTSCAPVWEPAAAATTIFAFDREYAFDFFVSGAPLPVARIEVDINALFDWSSYLYATGVDCHDLQRLFDCAFEIGSNPADWAVCPRPIPHSNWRAIDIWNGDAWIPIERSDAPELRSLAAAMPVRCMRNDQETLFSAKAWLTDIRNKGGIEWLDFMRYRNILSIEAREHDFTLAPDEIEEILTENDHVHPLFRVLLAIQYLPEERASRVVSEAGPDAIETLELNPLFARAAEKYCGIDQNSLVHAIRRRMPPMTPTIEATGNHHQHEFYAR